MVLRRGMSDSQIRLGMLQSVGREGQSALRACVSIYLSTKTRLTHLTEAGRGYSGRWMGEKVAGHSQLAMECIIESFVMLEVAGAIAP